jgi:signal transduction histidine kinase
LALWRIDTALAPLVAEESARPYFVYRPFFPVAGNLGRMLNPQTTAGSLVPSPLLRNSSTQVILHFQYGPDGQLTSPELPTGTDRTLAVPKYLSAKQVEETSRQLAAMARIADRARLAALLPKHDLPLVETAVPPGRGAEQRVASGAAGNNLRQSRSGREFDLRSNAMMQTSNMFVQSQQQFTTNSGAMPMYDITGVLMTPLWLDDRLLLARRFTAGNRQYIQGCLLDWPAIKTSLLEGIDDLLPRADLEPALAGANGDQSRMLAALPVRLLPGASTNGVASATSPMMLSLLVAWICVTVAGAAVAVLLWGVMRLSRRRAAFVSAVTHELRTPLTTFQMYAEMLADGMVPDVEQQHRYLGTLRNEAIRLTHLVENVLAYARLERGRTAGRIEPVELADLIAGVKARLLAHAEQSGMTLVVEGVEQHGAASVLANRSAVEQVLFNLVDNACKYAGAAPDMRIHLIVGSHGRLATIAVADHGPGPSAATRRRLFHSFSKSAEEAAVSAPGIGLGLALSRRLARDMGGDLRLDQNAESGARFILSLPRT